MKPQLCATFLANVRVVTIPIRYISREGNFNGIIDLVIISHFHLVRCISSARHLIVNIVGTVP